MPFPLRPTTSFTALIAACAFLVTGCATIRTGARPSASPASSPTASPAPSLAAGATGHIVIGPYVQPAGQAITASMNIVWWSDAPGPGELRWADAAGRTGGVLPAQQQAYRGLVRNVARIDRPADTDALRFMANVIIAGKRYSSPIFNVPFVPQAGKPLRFAAVGDTGAGTPAERAITAQIQKHNVNLLLITGDNVYSKGDWDEYRSHFFPYYGRLMATVPILPALGNHDVGNPAHKGEPFRIAWTPPANWSPPTAVTTPYSVDRSRSNKSEGPVGTGEAPGRNYSVDAGPCHFLCLDSTADRETIRTQIIPWARQDLASAKQRGSRWLIAFWHHPPYTRGAYRDNRLQWGDIRELFVPVMREANVQLVLLGHDHNYQHLTKDGIHYVITGAGGAKLYPIHPEYSGNDQPPLLGHNDTVHSFSLFDLSADGRTLTFQQITEDGRQLDTFRLTAP